jgi:hypothetical protein
VVKKDHTDGACVLTAFWWRNLQARNHLEDLGIDGRIVIKWI